MRNLLNAKWLLLLNTIPLLLLAALCYGEFTIIHTLLPAESLALWQQLALGLAGLATATLAYAAWAWRRGQPLSAWYAGAALLAYTAFLIWYTDKSSVVLPRDVPRWMVPTDILIYVWTFVMPTLAHALLVLVVRSVPDDRPRSALPSLALAIGVPMAAWLVLWLIEALWRVGGTNELAEKVFFFCALVCGPLTFLFFLVRGVYLLTLRRQDDEWSIIWKLLITLVLPLLGLLVNAGLVMNGLGTHEQGIFGNFNTPWFYGLALLNGVLLCLPRPAAPGWRLALLAARSVLLGYTFYFFLVFLPWLPLSLLAVIAIGMGFLMLTPLVLLVVHLRTLADDVAAVRAHFARWVPRAALVGGAAVLPLLLTADYYHDRRTLHAALAYVYSPDYARPYDLDAAALARTLAVVRQHKDSNRDLVMGTQQPYLSAYFNWLVLDNLMLSDAKLATLEHVFVHPAEAAPARVSFVNNVPVPTGPVLRKLTARSTYDASQQAWVSWVDLEVDNPSQTTVAGEYRTTFALPAGCWVGDYYLDIDGRREPGILAEQKAADWVYTQIVHQNDRRDPGLLTYSGPDQVRLQVYPVLGGATRRTGVQLLHKEPVTLTIDGQPVALGPASPAPPSAAPLTTPDGAVVYLGAAAKQQLPLVQRRPYYHFLLDASATKADRKDAYKEWVTTFLQAHKSAAPPRFTLVNTYATPVPAGADWQRQLDEFSNAGGCYLTGAVQRTLAEAWLHPAATYPVLVVVTDSLASTVLAPDFAALAPAYPESDTFLTLGPGGRAEAHSLRQAAAQVLPTAPPDGAAPAVRAWPTAAHPRAYLPDDARPAVVLSQPQAGLAPPASPGSRWQTGLLLRGFEQWQALHPAEADAQRLAFVQASFQSRVLSPLTAFLALENEAQKAALRRKQSQTLAANASLDTQEEQPNAPTAVPLDDYAPWLLLLGLGLGGWRLRRAPASLPGA